MNSQKALWSGDFGNEYLARNRVDWEKRKPFWWDIAKFTQCHSAFELGTSAGWNLLCLKECGVAHLTGVDINAQAVREAQRARLWVSKGDSSILQATGPLYDLTFTCGVLIHIAPEYLKGVMQDLIEGSKQYVLAVEYDSDAEKEVEYRGHKQALWKRPYGELYKELGLKIVETGEAQGFDRCNFWLMEKA